MNKKSKIIVIDDDQNLVTYLTTLLQDNGYDTVSAGDGQEGIEKVCAEQPDLILLDITMPEKSGVKFYREVRENPDTKSIPVIMVTGVLKEFEQFIKTRRQVPPPDGYFSKPFNPQELLAGIKKVLTQNGK